MQLSQRTTVFKATFNLIEVFFKINSNMTLPQVLLRCTLKKMMAIALSLNGQFWRRILEHLNYSRIQHHFNGRGLYWETISL